MPCGGCGDACKCTSTQCGPSCKCDASCTCKRATVRPGGDTTATATKK